MVKDFYFLFFLNLIPLHAKHLNANIKIIEQFYFIAVICLVDFQFNFYIQVNCWIGLTVLCKLFKLFDHKTYLSVLFSMSVSLQFVFETDLRSIQLQQNSEIERLIGFVSLIYTNGANKQKMFCMNNEKISSIFDYKMTPKLVFYFT